MKEDIIKFVNEIKKVQTKYKMKLSVDQANPFEMTVRSTQGNEEVLAWLGLSEATVKDEYILLADKT
jgi:hypothetical protein